MTKTEEADRGLRGGAESATRAPLSLSTARALKKPVHTAKLRCKQVSRSVCADGTPAVLLRCQVPVPTEGATCRRRCRVCNRAGNRNRSRETPAR